jgi:hypothetical protein
VLLSCRRSQHSQREESGGEDGSNAHSDDAQAFTWSGE